MMESFDLHKEAMEMLLATSRTFFIPISHLTERLQATVGSAYLCMRAIDEIEDHEELPTDVKIHLLRSVSRVLQNEQVDQDAIDTELLDVFQAYTSILPEVSLRLGDWFKLIPAAIAPSVRKATAVMADGMADWVLKEWRIQSEEDLDSYTFYVAGLVGVMLSDIWKWHSDIETDREMAIAFGRGLQAVNIIRNREEDLTRGVDFYPNGWGSDEMFAYAKRNLALADTYTASIEPGEIQMFCQLPLVLAHGTLDALEAGDEKLSRAAVADLVSRVTGEQAN
ncbi:MAG: squalene/phytoene synthase family protein [Tumebacillaceae bacterium]